MAGKIFWKNDSGALIWQVSVQGNESFLVLLPCGGGPFPVLIWVVCYNVQVMRLCFGTETVAQKNASYTILRILKSARPCSAGFPGNPLFDLLAPPIQCMLRAFNPISLLFCWEWLWLPQLLITWETLWLWPSGVPSFLSGHWVPPEHGLSTVQCYNKRLAKPPAWFRSFTPLLLSFAFSGWYSGPIWLLISHYSWADSGCVPFRLQTKGLGPFHESSA